MVSDMIMHHIYFLPIKVVIYIYIYFFNTTVIKHVTSGIIPDRCSTQYKNCKYLTKPGIIVCYCWLVALIPLKIIFILYKL